VGGGYSLIYEPLRRLLFSLIISSFCLFTSATRGGTADGYQQAGLCRCKRDVGLDPRPAAITVQSVEAMRCGGRRRRQGEEKKKRKEYACFMISFEGGQQWEGKTFPFLFYFISEIARGPAGFNFSHFRFVCIHQFYL
jgi:hypothetical protein